MKNFTVDVNGIELECQAENLETAKDYFENSGYPNIDTSEIIELGETDEI